ncbi:MAG: Stk1 family PASTA domain-containing Ser/Thr kinase [bacterium]|nr:Stk1 family PASTA domain-containing Ser/Thr kinase [bacterium]
MNPVAGDALIGRLVDGRYEVTQRIARGGMATVYHAVDRRLDREVAVKIMHSHLAESDDFVARFRREARAAARLSHPNVVGVYDQGLWHDSFYLTMEYVEGEDLRARLQREGTLTLDESLAITENVLEALAAAHRRELVHRDIKPENVMIDTEGVVKVADFGLARAVSDSSAATTGTVLGTVAYLAPELVTDGETSPSGDVYAAGILLYEMLTGHQPFTGDLPIKVAMRHVHETVPAPSNEVRWIPAEIDSLVAAMTAREPMGRLQDGQSALAMLRRARAGLDHPTLGRRAEAPTDGTGASSSGNHTAPLSRKVSSGTVALPVGEIRAEQAAGAPTGTAKVTPRRRRSRAKGILLTLFFLAAVAGGIFAWYYFYGPGSHVPVPGVVNQTSQRAVTLLEAEGFVPRIDQVHSDDVAENRVISQDPEAESEARKGAEVTLVVSLGVEMFEMPDLMAFSLEDAQTALADARFGAPTLTESWHEEIPEGALISATVDGTPITPGEPYDHRTIVNLEVSKGREPVAVPDLSGQDREGVATVLEEAGLLAQFAQPEYSEEVAEGRVIRQSPGAADGIQLYRGDTVTVVLSLGMPYVEMPDLFGMSADEAEETVRELGLVPDPEFWFQGVFDRVRFQDPAAETPVRMGETVTYTVW